MGLLETIMGLLPEVKAPDQKNLDFGTKFKWTLIILVAYYLLSLIPLNGLGGNALQQFTFFSTILGASFGSLITLGIGPIVTASIILQLLNGSGIIDFNLQTEEGKKRFQGWQKLLSIFFIVFEGIIFVASGGLSPSAGVSPAWIMIQLMIGGYLIMIMDEVVSKWGFGSGLSLFIAAGVSKELMIRLLSPLSQGGALAWPFGTEAPVGAVFAVVYAITSQTITDFLRQLVAIVMTFVVFAIAVYAMAMKVEIPLSFGRARGYGVRWPLNFMYTSNIPVILIAALIANIQLAGQLLAQRGITWIGQFSGGQPVSGLATWLYPVHIIDAVITGTLTWVSVAQALVYMLIFALGSMVFAVFWVQSSGMDAKSLAKQIMDSGLQVPGFRRDPRVMERLLERYVMPLAVMGGLAIGVIAALADLSGALGSGTGILLSVMIVYQLYQEIAKQHQMDMHPLMKKFVEGS